jgi:hypothetical protein
MLSDREIKRLCRGRVVDVVVMDATGSYELRRHPAVMVDTDAEIKEAIGKGQDFYVVLVSTNTTMDPPYSLLPADTRLGLRGYYQCATPRLVSMANIEVRDEKLNELEFGRIFAKIQECHRLRTAKKKGK